MPEVMLRKNDKGQINFYIAKKDMEEIITSLEFDSPDKWGGKVVLADDSEYYIEPFDAPPKLPITIRVKRL